MKSCNGENTKNTSGESRILVCPNFTFNHEVQDSYIFTQNRGRDGYLINICAIGSPVKWKVERNI